MNKKISMFTFLFILLLFFPFSVNASYSATIKGDNVRIRSGANTDSSVLYTVNSNTAIDVLDKTLISGTGCSAKWYKISYKDKTGYVCSTYVNFVNTSYAGINVIDWTARVNANNVAVRSKSDVSSTKVDTLTLGCNVTILDEVSGSSTSCSNGKWYKIQFSGNKTGYICKKYVTKKSDITASNSEYSKTLSDAGFPESYIPYLTYLHNKYPNWKFIAKNTKTAFSSSVSNEEGKNYMQTTNDNYRTSSTPAEGSSWYKVNSGVIAFYMDPRNWLSEERVFMFEKQDYSSELEESYKSIVKSIFGNGKLGDDKYTIPMLNAGKTNKISPVLIASRIRLEVGADGTDSTNGTEFTWKGKKYSGYYNFFNIGAYEVTIDGVSYSSITRGLAYAAKLINRDGNVWNDIEVAITEGSSFLANGYVTKGQGTLYYQKFNVSPDAYYSSFTHQYMTNIQAPATEGNQSYSSYKTNSMLDQSFVFEIPVYTNMPSYTSLPNTGDTNNYLSSLSVNDYSISPKFDKDVLSYEIYVPTSINKITINATSASSVATISGAGEVELETDKTDITVLVTSQSGDERKYVITINRVEDTTKVSDVISSTSYVINSNYLTKIKNSTNVSTIQSLLIKNGAKKVEVFNAKGDSASGVIGTGYKITITTGLESKTFTICVNGDTSGDGKVTILDLLQIQKHIKGSSTLADQRKIAGDTSGDGKITILDLLQIQKHIKGAKSL